MDDIHTITIRLRAPKGNDPGKVAIGHYVVNPDNYVVLCDENGKPTGDEKHHLDAAGDAKLIACGMLRRRQNASGGPSGFNDRLLYPKLKF